MNVSVARAAAEIDAITAVLARDHPETHDEVRHVTVTVPERFVGSDASDPTWFAFLSAGFAGPSDRLRQRRQPAAHAGGAPRPGDRGADVAGRQPVARHPAIADREHTAGISRRAGGQRSRHARSAGAGQRHSRRHAGVLDHLRLRYPGVRRDERHRRRNRVSLRSDPGPRGVARRRRVARARRAHRRGPDHQSLDQCVPDGRVRPDAHPAGGGLRIRAQLPRCATHVHRTGCVGCPDRAGEPDNQPVRDTRGARRVLRGRPQPARLPRGDDGGDRQRLAGGRTRRHDGTPGHHRPATGGAGRRASDRPHVGDRAGLLRHPRRAAAAGTALLRARRRTRIERRHRERAVRRDPLRGRGAARPPHPARDRDAGGGATPGPPG